jgi:hypothetical protein
MNNYAKWFGRVVWLGIIANLFFIIPLLFGVVEGILLYLAMREQPAISQTAKGFS